MYIKFLHSNNEILDITDKYDSLGSVIEKISDNVEFNFGVRPIYSLNDGIVRIKYGGIIDMIAYETTAEEWAEWNLLR